MTPPQPLCVPLGLTMEFPDLGKHCSEKTCKRLGKRFSENFHKRWAFCWLFWGESWPSEELPGPGGQKMLPGPSGCRALSPETEGLACSLFRVPAAVRGTTRLPPRVRSLEGVRDGPRELSVRGHLLSVVCSSLLFRTLDCFVCVCPDFLPLKCDACEREFCKDHFARAAHKCPSAFKKVTALSPKDLSVSKAELSAVDTGLV